MKTIDINCDLGEGNGDDRLLMPYISSCSIACGGHYGDQSTIKKTLASAKEYALKVGAHPAYPDQQHFGRRSMHLPKGEFQNAIRQQLDLFFDLATNVHHIKPHGALYNDLFTDEEKTHWLLEVIGEYHPGINIYCAPNSVLAQLAHQSGFRPIFEGFGDRLYTQTGRLVERSQPGSVLADANSIAKQIVKIVSQGLVITKEGTPLEIKVKTICLHSDTPGLFATIKPIIARLNKNKINVAAL